MSSRSSVLTQGLGPWSNRGLIVTLGFGAAVVPATATITGTIFGATEDDIRAGGKTIIITLSNATLVSSGSFSTLKGQVINGITSSGSEATGWNNIFKPLQGTARVIRTSPTVITITLDPFSGYDFGEYGFTGYDITANETITVTVPSSVLLGSPPAVVATPTFTISFVTPVDTRPSGGIPSRDLGDRGPTAEQTRKSRIRVGLLPEEALVIEEVALRQVENLGLDDQQKLDELRGEMKLRGLEVESKHIQALNAERERLIDLEIARLFGLQREEDEMLMLIMLAAV